MDDLLFFRLQKSFPGIQKTDVNKLMAQAKVDQQTVMNWAKKDLLGVGNNGLEKIGSIPNSSINPATL